MNWGELVDAFESYVGNSYFTESSIKIFMQKALRRINANSKVIKKRQAVNLTAGQRLYDLPSDCHEVYRVTYDGHMIEPYTQARLDAESRTWRNASGEPYLYYVDRLNNQIGLYRTPDVSTTVAGASQEDGVAVLMGASEDGLIIDISTDDGFPMAEDGIPVLEMTGNHLEVFYWAEPADYHPGSEPDLPQWAQHVLVWSALAEAYRAGLPDVDEERAAAFALMAGDLEERIQGRTANVINKTWNRNQGRGQKTRSIQQRYPATIGDV